MYEIFEEFEKAETKEDRIGVLRRNANFALKSVLKGTFNNDVQFVIDRVPMYKPSDAPAGLGYTTIHQELGRAYLDPDSRSSRKARS